MTNNNWTNLHSIYKKQDWIKLPSIFAEQAITYFPESGKILELGSGYGQDSIYFAKHDYEVTGTDIETDALRENLLANPSSVKDKIKTVQLDLRQPMAFEDNSFDVVYAHLSLHYFDQSTTERIFDDIKRILKSDGILAYFTNSTSDPEYDTGKKLEEGYYEIEGEPKRYLNVETAGRFAHEFSPLLLDNNGETYKDSVKGIHNLIRFIGRKI